LGPQIGNPIIKKIANNSKTVQNSEKVTIDHLWEVGVGLSNFTFRFVVMATGSGKPGHMTQYPPF